jgi:toxin ParE1/3/4
MPKVDLPIAWSADAEEDLFEIWAYLRREASISVADRVARRIIGSCQRLSAWPYSGRNRDDLLLGIRSIVSSPYVVFYRVSDDNVEIVRVLHGRRDIDAIFKPQGLKPGPDG